MTKKQQIFLRLVELSGSHRSWVSRADLIRSLGWADSVSALLNRLVAERRVEQGKWEGEGMGGRMCDGFRPALARQSLRPAVRDALKVLAEVKTKMEEVERILQTAK